MSDISLFILLWLLVALCGVHPSYDRELLRPETYLMEVIFNMKNLVPMTWSEFNRFTGKHWELHWSTGA